MHYATLYGRQVGWFDIPSAQGYRRPLPSSQDECSPFTWDKNVFQGAMETTGSVGSIEEMDAVLFESKCVAELPDDVSLDMDARLQDMAGPLRESRCSGNESLMLAQGLHTLVTEMAQRGLLLSTDREVTAANPNYAWIDEHDKDEFYLGLLSATVLYQNDALRMLRQNKALCLTAFIAFVCITVAQYVLLGRSIKDLLTEHQMMNQVIERLLSEAVLAEKTLQASSDSVDVHQTDLHDVCRKHKLFKGHSAMRLSVMLAKTTIIKMRPEGGDSQWACHSWRLACLHQ